MSTQVHRQPLLPRATDGRRQGIVLSVLVHIGLVIAIALGLHWRSHTPEASEAELWAAVPQAAAPREALPVVTPAPPTPAPAPEPAPKVVEPPAPLPDAQIAIEKARKEQERQAKEAAEREALKKKLAIEKAEKAEKAAQAEKAAAAEKAAQEARDAEKAAELRPPRIPTSEERVLAAQAGDSVAAQAARRLVAEDYYVNQAGWAPGRAASHLNGIDWSKPVQVVKLPAGELDQWVAANGKLGNYFAPKGTQAGELGINPAGRNLGTFKMPPGEGLQSTAAPILDTWSDPLRPYQARGGGTQIFVSDAQREAIKVYNGIP